MKDVSGENLIPGIARFFGVRGTVFPPKGKHDNENFCLSFFVHVLKQCIYDFALIFRLLGWEEP